MATAILGLGHHLPAAVERGGVSRPIAVDPIGPSTLAVPAAASALAQAGYDAGGVDFIIFATMTPDVTFPGAGCYFQHQMQCGTVGALDLRAQCAGFIYGMSIADQFVRAGVYQHVLLIGAEVHSSGLDPSEAAARITPLFGDGAGVALLGNGTGAAGIRSAVIHSDGRRHRDFWCEYPASRQHPLRMTVEDFRAGKHFPRIDFDSVRRFGEASLVAVIGEALQQASLTAERIDRFIIGHLLPDVAEQVGRRLGIDRTRLSIPAQRHGHLTAAAVPVALSEAVASGALGPGAMVCVAASGAGFTWGAAVLTL